MKTTKSILFTFLITVVFAFSGLQSQEKITIVAAANLKPAMDSIITIYKAQNSNSEIQVIYGASGKLYEQISNGAPFDIFFSADMEYPNKLKKNKLTASDVKLYAIGQLVLWSKRMNPNDKQINALLETSIKRISIANPKTAPYGEKAIESMKYYKIYDKIKNKLVYGENITQAMQFVTLGAADIGINALSMVLSPIVKKTKGKYWIIPKESYKPLEQGCVILKQAKENAMATKFYNFISSEKVVDILTYFGYNQKDK